MDLEAGLDFCSALVKRRERLMRVRGEEFNVFEKIISSILAWKECDEASCLI